MSPPPSFAPHSKKDVPPRLTSSAPLAPPGIPAPDRWSLGAWIFLREGSGTPNLSGAGQLGGSQAGIRIAYDLTPNEAIQLAPYTRFTSALQRPAQMEAAIGLALRPSRHLPVTVAAERRIDMAQGGRNAFAAYASANIGPFDLPARLHLDGYAQGGLVGFQRVDGFVDGKLSLRHGLDISTTGDSLSAGVSLSGGAQPGLSRLDIGPEISARLPSGQGSARLSLEWRERVHGNARPGSGATLTLAADF